MCRILAIICILNGAPDAAIIWLSISLFLSILSR